jgi:hypothetical protein
VAVTRIYDAGDVQNPAHIRMAYTDVVRNHVVVQIVYTGKIYVGHGAGGTTTFLGIQLPMIGLFRENTGVNTRGIIPLDPEREFFIGATAMVGLTGLWDKTDPQSAGVTKVRADLYRVDLGPTNLQILAVVLTAEAYSYQSEVQYMDYQVNVIHGFHSREPGEFRPPILANSPDWNGKYGAIGASPVAFGQPSETLP